MNELRYNSEGYYDPVVYAALTNIVGGFFRISEAETVL